MKSGKSGPLSGSIQTRLYGGNCCYFLSKVKRILRSEITGLIAVCVMGAIIGWVICDALARGLI